MEAIFDNNRQNITLRLDVHTLALKIKQENEENYRRAAMILNERFVFLRKKLPLSTSSEVVWLHVALESCVNLVSDSREKALEPIHKEITNLNAMIDNALGDFNEHDLNIK